MKKIKALLLMLGFMAHWGASAQMPVPLLDGLTATPAKDAHLKLETLLSCKGVKSLNAKAVEAQFQGIGLLKGVEGFYLPAPKGETPILFGGQVVAALVTVGEGEVKAMVYLKKQTGKQLAKKLGATEINEYADTEEPSYLKQISKKTILMVGSASEVFIGNDSIKYQAAVGCKSNQ